MRPYIFATLLATTIPLTALAQQPFERFGVQVKVVTLSDGRYPEFFANDSLRRIGSVVYNTRLHRIAYLLPSDSLAGRPKPDVTSRWLSLDPFAQKYPSISPYAYVANSPIVFIDPDGRFILHAQTAKDYPVLANFIKNLSIRYNDKPQEFRDAFKQFSQLSDDQIREVLTDGSGPTLRVINLDENGEQTNGFTHSKKLENGSLVLTGIDNVIPDPSGFIDIDDDVADMLELAGNMAEAAAGELVVESTVLHEAVHYGRVKKGVESYTAVPEPGQAFEEKAYGANISRGNADQVANPAIRPIAPKEVELETNVKP